MKNIRLGGGENNMRRADEANASSQETRVQDQFGLVWFSMWLAHMYKGEEG